MFNKGNLSVITSVSIFIFVTRKLYSDLSGIKVDIGGPDSPFWLLFPRSLGKLCEDQDGEIWIEVFILIMIIVLLKIGVGYEPFFLNQAVLTNTFYLVYILK